MESTITHGTIATFEAWMHSVDEYCAQLAGLSVYDLSDQCYADWWEDGMSPKTAARKAIRSDGGDF